MLTQLKALLFTDTGRDTVVALTGTVINAFIGGLFFIFAPRILGPEQYGLFAVASSTGIMIAGLANLGIDTGILRFIKEGNTTENNKILKLSFELYLWIGAAIFILGLVLAKPLATILGIENVTPLLRIASAGVLFILLTNFFIAELQTRKKFFSATLVNTISNSARLLTLGIAAYFFAINVYFLTALFFGATIISALVAKSFVPLDFLKAENHRENLKVFFSFNSWIAASFAISLIPIDNYLLVKYAGPVATGLYAAPFKILSIVDQLAGNFSRVLSSRLSSFTNHQDALNFTKKIAPIVVLISICFLSASLIAQPLVNILLGREFSQSVFVFRIIAISSIATFAAAIPVSIILYYFKQPKVAFIITLASVAIWIVLSLKLIPTHHQLGAAWAYLLTEVATFAFFTMYVILRFTKNSNGRN